MSATDDHGVTVSVEMLADRMIGLIVYEYGAVTVRLTMPAESAQWLASSLSLAAHNSIRKAKLETDK